MSSHLLWYTARATGIIGLALFSAVAVLGLMARARVEAPWWPRFLSVALHRDLSLISLVFLTIHIVTAVVDPYTHLGVVAAVVPFGSYYRTFWLGLGTLSVELALAIVVTSLVRERLGARLWRAVHWLAYASWPIAVAHGLGTGTDALAAWSLWITAGCCASVAAALGWRMLHGTPAIDREKRLAAG